MSKEHVIEHLKEENRQLRIENERLSKKLEAYQQIVGYLHQGDNEDENTNRRS